MVCHTAPWCGGKRNCTEDPDKFAILQVIDACPPGQFSCRTTIEGPEACLQMTFKCDGQTQCIDGYDEADCEKSICEDDEIRCRGNDGRCVFKRYICDGKRDCRDGWDESETLCFLYKHCPRGQLPCSSQNDSIICVDEALRCEEPAQCKNGSRDSRLCDDLASQWLGSFFHCANANLRLPPFSR
ncbi:low-density lipoprotein receptor-like [Rhipicephalus sanguineus]|uniref:low-density lipoprotein receptor-like n=1 Tax=Rhipicephalus sanguineus TaxID=34632 RepID=UPI0018945637|nr:low-density lipoprotein receptor-like [Rhipicephalus sanguineus]